MWGGTPLRNMVSPEKNPPTDWRVPTEEDHNGLNILWTAALGSKSYGNPIVVNGVVYVGTNNEGKRDPTLTADGGVLMAFDKKTGKFLWQRYSAKLPTGRVNDWPGEGQCATVYTEPGRLWYCTNRCEVVCLATSPGEMTNGLPKELWTFDMIGKLGVFPHNMTASSIAAWHDYVFVITGNGVDDTHKHVVAPKAPSIVCHNKVTGEFVWSNNTPGANVLHGQWASPAVVEVNGVPLVIAPLGDAWVYAFDARDGKIVWKFDCNLKDAVYPQTRNEADRHARDRGRQNVHRHRPGPGARRRRGHALVRGHHQDRRRFLRAGRPRRRAQARARAGSALPAPGPRASPTPTRRWSGPTRSLTSTTTARSSASSG